MNDANSTETSSETAELMCLPVQDYHDEEIRQKEHKENVNGLKITNIRMNNYALNAQLKIKEKLRKIDSEFKISPRDKNRQYHFEMSTPTYHLFIENLIEFGKQLKLDIKNNDTDITGEMVKTQFTMNIPVQDGPKIPISITCYHTKNSMLVQLMGNNTDYKLKGLGHFINNTLASIIKEVEQSKEHGIVKGMLVQHFQKAQNGLTGNSKGGKSSKMQGTNTVSLAGAIAITKTTSNLDAELESKEIYRNKATDNHGEDQPTEEKMGGVTQNVVHYNVPSNLVPSQERADNNEHQSKFTKPLLDQNIPSQSQIPKISTCKEKAESSHGTVHVINELKVKLEEANREKKNLSKHVESLNRQLKDFDQKTTSNNMTNEKLEKMTKLRDQMSAAVQSLKQENGVLKAQQETNNSTIQMQKDTINSLTEIIANYEEKLAEKEAMIANQNSKLKEQGIGFDLHREIAYKFMEVANEDGEGTTEAVESSSTGEIKKLYTQLRIEESRTQELTTEIDNLKTEQLRLQSEISESNLKAKQMEEDLKNQLSKHAVSATENENNSRKDMKKLKDALKESENARHTLTETVAVLEGKISEISVVQQVDQVLKGKDQVTEKVQAEMQVAISDLRKSLEQEKEQKEKLEKDLTQSNQELAEMKETQQALQNSNEKIGEMTQLFREKELKIRDLEEYVKFMDASAEEKDSDLKTMQGKLIELEKENVLIIRAKNKLESDQQDAQNDNQELKFKYSSSTNQVEQLLHLNNQLKTHISLLEGKINTPASGNNLIDDSKDALNREGSQHGERKGSPVHKLRDIQEYCYAELKQEGSCTKHRENKCRFTHEIPESVKKDKEEILTNNRRKQSVHQ